MEYGHSELRLANRDRRFHVRSVSLCRFVLATLVDIRSSLRINPNGPTLSYPAFEPLTEHHALMTG